MTLPDCPNLEYALQYAARGWRIFPLRPRSKLPLIAKKDGGKGYKDATSDSATIERWWRACPTANIGLATGLSGLVVLDPDGPEGLAQLHELTRQHGPLPRTLVAKTGREGGFHIIFSGSGVKSTAGNKKTGNYLDVRADGGYIVLAPSIHPSGAAYEWVNNTVPVAPLPVHVLEWLETKRDRPAAPTPPAAVAVDLKVNNRGLAARSIANLTESPSFNRKEANRLRSALSAIDAATDYSTWIAYGAALHDLKWRSNEADYGFEIWNEWSARAAPLPAPGGYPGRAILEQKWLSFDREYNGVRTTVASILKAAMDQGWQHAPEPQNVNGSEALHALPEAFVAAQAAAPIVWPDRDQWGRPKQTCRNARTAIRHLGVTCEHDRFHDKLIVGGRAIEQWTGELTDNTTHMLRVTIAQRYNVDPGTTNTFDAAVQECLQRSYDPVADYLDGLVWDGSSRLRTWLSVYMGAADTVLNSAIGGLMLIAAVRRVRSPGCKFDQILVLISDEGKNKSSAIEILAGPGNFSDQTILTLDDRAQQEALSGVWLYEIADLAGMSKADTERVKAFASRRIDRARPAYARARVDKPRRCVFFASTNHATFLKSQTGNRRFWPVEVGRIDLTSLARDRDQLWAEAAACEARGVPLMLPEALWGDASVEQEKRRDTDPWDDILSSIEPGTKGHNAKLKSRPDGMGNELRIMTREIFENVLRVPVEKLNDVTPKRVAFIMRRLGWDGPKIIRDGEIVGRGFTKPV